MQILKWVKEKEKSENEYRAGCSTSIQNVQLGENSSKPETSEGSVVGGAGACSIT